MSEKQRFWNRHTNGAILLFILYGYFSLSIISGATILNLRSVLDLLVPLLGSAYCLFLVKTLQNRSKNQIKLGWVIAYLMVLLTLSVAISHLNQIIPLLFNLFFVAAWFDLGNYLRKSNN